MSDDVPFSFRMGGTPSSEVLARWQCHRSTVKVDHSRTRVVAVRSDPITGLEVRTEGVVYSDYPAVEWTVTLKNRGKKDSPMIDRLQGLDADFARGNDEEFVLHHNVGAPADGSDYSPISTPLPRGFSLRMAGAGGRPTNSDWSYFNLAWGHEGAIVVVGWPGQWAAEITHENRDIVHMRAGQQNTHFRLHPGEEVRTPLIVVLKWKGDWIDGQNDWRHWMMAYGMPHPNGKLPQPMMLGYSGRPYGEMIGANESNQIMFIDRYLQERLPLAYWWMDAGWYVQTQGWPQVGTWEVDRKRFPNGLKPISEHAHAKGLKTLVWFEPERVAANTWLSDKHPEWLLDGSASIMARRSSKLGGSEPCVFYNPSDRPVDLHGIHWAPRSVAFHPGPKGEYSDIRYAAPVAGDYRIQAAFTGIDEKTTTDVHVLASGKSLFDSFILLEGHGRNESFSGTVHLAAGESINFVVGYGNGEYYYDSTGLNASVTGPDGVVHDAATEYGKKNWSYGYLPAAKQPDSASFSPYDRNEKMSRDSDQLLDLGNREARTWLTNHIDRLLVDNEIDLYRQDFNIDPLAYWQANDADDRQGITENHYVVGYLAYWDELRRRHPNMLIDSCASGGRRNDLETMRRAVPLWRSDYAYKAIPHQCMTYGISMWLPFYGTGTVANETAPYYGSGSMPVRAYDFWSTACPSIMSALDMRATDTDYAALRTLYSDWQKLWPYYYGDYHPLTEFSRDEDGWMAWSFDLPDHSGGLVEAFRRPKAQADAQVLKLRGLDPEGRYRLSVLEGATLDREEATGRDLMDQGIVVRVPGKPGTGIMLYRKL